MVWKAKFGAIIKSLLKSQLSEIWRKDKSFEHRKHNESLLWETERMKNIFAANIFIVSNSLLCVFKK